MQEVKENNLLRWTSIIVLSVVFTSVLLVAKLPAALMFGPMLAAIVVERIDLGPKLPKVLFGVAQAAIGCLIAKAMTPSIMTNLANQWTQFIVITAGTVGISCLLGWLVSRGRMMPGTTAVWGLLPGAASAMMILAEEFGADSRLVAFMQYLRVVIVGLTASIITRFWVQNSAIPSAGQDWFAPFNMLGLVFSILIIFIGTALGPSVKVPASTLLIPMVLGCFLQLFGIAQLELPQWFLAFPYCFLGWYIGLRFTKESLKHAFQILPMTLGLIFTMIVFGAGLAWTLVRFCKIDPLSAYLATSPGGMDAVAIIASSVDVNMPLIMSMQMARFLMVLIVGPPISKFIATRIDSRESERDVISEGTH